MNSLLLVRIACGTGLGLLGLPVAPLRLRRPAWQAGVPMVFMIVMTVWAMVVNLHEHYITQPWHLLTSARSCWCWSSPW